MGGGNTKETGGIANTWAEGPGQTPRFCVIKEQRCLVFSIKWLQWLFHSRRTPLLLSTFGENLLYARTNALCQSRFAGNGGRD